MKRLSEPLLFAAVSAFVVVSVASAHHSMAMYDLDRQVAFAGVVTSYQWANPHVYISVRVDGPGEPGVWTVEGGPPVLMARWGWSPVSLVPGEHVKFTGNPAVRAERRMVLASSVERADGTVLRTRDRAVLIGGGESPASVGTATLDGTWLTLAGPTIGTFLLTPEILPVTEEGAAAIADFDDELSPENDCVPFTSPLLMTYPDTKTIEIRDDRVVIATEFEGVTRMVRMNVGSHDGVEPSLQGHSIGRWEGDVLIVDTARFLPHLMGNAHQLASGASKHLIERFALDPDHKSLTYRFELTDPEYLATPVVGESRWIYRPDLTPTVEPCDPEVARRYLED